MTIQFSYDWDAYCKRGAKRHARLMNLPAKVPTVQITSMVVNLANGLPAWRRGQGISFDDHVEAYRKSSRFAQGPNVYIRRRAIEMGFAPEDVLEFVRFRPLVALRALLIWEIHERFSLPICTIAEMLELNLTSAHRAKNSPRPDPVKVCVCAITKPGQSYFDALKEQYHSNLNLEDAAERFGISSMSFHRVAHKNGWRLRPANRGGRKPL